MTPRCEDCQKGLGPRPFFYNNQPKMELKGIRFNICPVCAGRLIAALLAYFKERTRLGLRGPRRKKDSRRPLRAMGAWRCRRCEVQLKDYQVGHPAYCEECRDVD